MGKIIQTTLATLLTVSSLAFGALADEVIETVDFDGEVITISQTDEGEQVISFGEQELGRNFFAGFDRVAEVSGMPVALFYLGDGGNACGPSTLIVWREDEATLQSLNYTEGCNTPAPAISDNGILFVPYLSPGETRPLKRWSAPEGIRTMGNLSYTPELGTGWQDLAANPVGHPLDFFGNEAVYNSAASLLGDNLEQYAKGLRVASEPQTLQSGMIMASGCIPHNCGSGDAFIAVDTMGQTLYLAQQDGSGHKYWPDLASWPAPALEALEIYKTIR
jgi:hypothetical protein